MHPLGLVGGGVALELGLELELIPGLTGPLLAVVGLEVQRDGWQGFLAGE